MIRRALANVYLHPLHIHIMHMKMSTNVDINICKYAQRCKVGCTVFGYAHRTHAPSHNSAFKIWLCVAATFS